MNINWKVRFSNPVFIFNFCVAIAAPILLYYGINWSDVTSWPSLGHYLFSAVQNPALMVSIAISVYNCINDPTTPGLKDSEKALGYCEPGVTRNEQQ